MKKRIPHNLKYTFDVCKEEALKYNTKTEFEIGSRGAYGAAVKKKWMPLICGHMTPIGSKYERLIYVFEFPNKTAYVGLTFNEKKRYDEHMTNAHRKKSPVFKYITDNNILPIYKLLTGYIDVYSAIDLEKETIENYKLSGWTMLNTSKGGGIGSSIMKWSKEEVIKAAKKCNNRSEFKRKYPAAYRKAHSDNLWDECAQHMRSMERPHGYWTFERCKETALLYNTKTELKNNCSSVYGAAFIHGWIDEICSHMTSNVIRKPPNYWTFNRCEKEAKKYQSRIEYKTKNRGSYASAINNKWLDKICNHMATERKPSGYWNYETCKEAALKCKTRKEFSKIHSAYLMSTKNGWLKEITSHMPKKAPNKK